MKDNIFVKISCIPVRDQHEAVVDVLKCLEHYDNVEIKVKEQGEWLE